MSVRVFLVAMAGFTALAIYLFLSAPPTLANEEDSGRKVPIEVMFRALAAENDAVRGLYTKEIVGRGKGAGLRFDERWERNDIEAGPLPALFLRGVAGELERSSSAVSLFLGSDFPISSNNAFNGVQATAFDRLKAQDNAPQFFVDEITGRQTALFADVAVAKPCVDCHNEHPDSPKTDWSLGDVMGATTWMHPDQEVSLQEILWSVESYRAGVRAVYEAYLEKTRSFSDPPEIGARWPREGSYLPSSEVFIDAYVARASPDTLATLLAPLGDDVEAP